MLDKPVERQRFYRAILEAFADGKEMTARECSEALLPTGLTLFGLRQETQPRIVECIKFGWLEACGSKIDMATHKTVTVYRKA